MDREQIAAYIVEKILPRHLSFAVTYTEYLEDGSVSLQYTERSQKIFDEIVNILEKYES